MYRTPRDRRQAAARRAGFTLVEMLVVIAIIALLVTLTAGAAFMLMGWGKKSTTQTYMKTTMGALDQQWNALIDQAKSETPSAGELSLAGGDYARARVIHIHLRLRQEFPASYSEAYNPPQDSTYGINLSPKDAYHKVISLALASASTGSASEASACLLLALSQNRRGMAAWSPDQALGSGALATNSDGLKVIVDAWGQPMAFFRWPTGNSELSGLGGANPVNPLDPEGTLVKPSWNNFGNAQAVLTFEKLCGGNYTIHTGTTATTWQPVVAYTRPTIASAGPDGKWGINPGDMSPTASSGDANDNLYSYRLVYGGRGD